MSTVLLIVVAAFVDAFPETSALRDRLMRYVHVVSFLPTHKLKEEEHWL